VTPLDIFLIFTTCGVAILTAVLVPTLLQLKRTYRKVEDTLKILEKELTPMSRKITEAASELELLAATCNARVEEADVVLRTARQAGDTLLLTSRAMKDSIRPIISGIGGLSAGLQMFSRALFSGRKKN